MRFSPSLRCGRTAVPLLLSCVLSVPALLADERVIVDSFWDRNGSNTWDLTTSWTAGAVPDRDTHVRFPQHSSTNRVTHFNFASAVGDPEIYPAGVREVGAISLDADNLHGRIIRPNNAAGHDGILRVFGIPYELDGQPTSLLFANHSVSDSGERLLALRDSGNSVMDIVLMASGVVHAAPGATVELTNNRILEEGGSFSITKTGEGTLQVSTASTAGYSGGTYINLGTVLFGRTGSLGSGTIYLGQEGGGDVALLRNLGGWDMNNDVIVAENLVGTATMGASLGSSTLAMRVNGTITLGSDLILHTDMTHSETPGTINFNGDFIGSRTLTKTGIGRLGITGENAGFSGQVIIEDGIVEIGFDSSVSGNGLRGTLGTGDVVNNAELRIHRYNDYVMPNNISGTGTFVQAETGRTALTGTNTYTGQTLVEQGGLLVMGTLNGTSDVLVEQAGTLGGTGVITGPVVVHGGLSASDLDFNPGVLTLNGDLTLGATSQSTFYIAGSEDYSQIQGIGDLVLDGTVSVLLSDYSPAESDSFVLLAWSGTLDSSGFDVSSDLILPALDGGLYWDTSGFLDTGTLSVIPEPGTYAAALGALALALVVYRRRLG